MFVVLRRLEAEQRKFETVLPAGFAVATAGIATGLGENRHDLVGKVDRRNIFELLDRNRERRGQLDAFSLPMNLPLPFRRGEGRGEGSVQNLRGDRSRSFSQR